MGRRKMVVVALVFMLFIRVKHWGVQTLGRNLRKGRVKGRVFVRTRLVAPS